MTRTLAQAGRLGKRKALHSLLKGLPLEGKLSPKATDEVSPAVEVSAFIKTEARDQSSGDTSSAPEGKAVEIPASRYSYCLLPNAYCLTPRQPPFHCCLLPDTCFLLPHACYLNRGCLKMTSF